MAVSGGGFEVRPSRPRAAVISARLLPSSDGSNGQLAMTTFFGIAAAPVDSDALDDLGLDLGPLVGRLQPLEQRLLPAGQRPLRETARPVPVLDAVYGYSSMVTSTPRARASSISRRVSTLLPQFAAPMIL